MLNFVSLIVVSKYSTMSNLYVQIIYRPTWVPKMARKLVQMPKQL